MFSRFRSQCAEVVKKILAARGIAREFGLQVPPLPELGDLSTNVCFDLASELKKSPVQIAEEFAREAKPPKDSFIREIKAASGYVNFYIDGEKLAKPLIEEIKKLDASYGHGKKKGKIILEHTSANPDGPLHIGHGRNAIIGDTLARIFRFAGHEVETQFYVNDMGRQLAIVVFARRSPEIVGSPELVIAFLSLVGKGTLKNDDAIGRLYVAANKMLEEKPELDQNVAELMRRYEAGDKAVVKEFEDAANFCLVGFKETLSRIGVGHDAQVWESRFVRDSSVKKILDRLRKTEYAVEGEVLSLNLISFGIEKELILTRKDGTYLYTTRDIAYHLWKQKAGRAINIWGADHKLVAEQLKAALRILGEEAPEFIIYEFISLPEGSMSTRRGVFISLDELIDESVGRAYAEVAKRRPELSEEEKKSIAEKVGVAAVRYNIARISPEKGMVFKWEEALDFERQGAPFIQYAHARACRILEKERPPKVFRAAKLTENEERLLLEISKFPEAVEEAAESRKASTLANYAFRLADDFHKFYRFEPVLESEAKDFRLNLVEATRITLRNALGLLGIEAMERM